MYVEAAGMGVAAPVTTATAVKPPDVQKWVRNPVTSVNRLCNLSK